MSLGKVLLVALERNVSERALALLKKTYMQQKVEVKCLTSIAINFRRFLDQKCMYSSYSSSIQYAILRKRALSLFSCMHFYVLLLFYSQVFFFAFFILPYSFIINTFSKLATFLNMKKILLSHNSPSNSSYRLY